EAYADAAGEREVIKQYLRNQAAAGIAEAEVLAAEADELLAGRFDAQRHRGRLRRLSDVLAETGGGPVDLLKVDVQRAEMDVLAGIDDKDWAAIRQVVLEVHDRAGSPTAGRVQEVVKLLAARGYATIVDQEESLRGTDRYMVYASRFPL